MPTDPHTPAQLAASPRRAWTMALTLAVVAVVQFWIVTGGSWRHWSQYTARYSELADSFLHGRLSLIAQPSPALLALPDPYDPAANGPYRLHDASLFHGKYYYYWGPAPAVLIAGACRIMGISEPDFGDEYVAFTFVFGATILAAVLILLIRARLFPNLPPGTAALPILSLALGAPILCGLSRAAIYETAIFAGQFFLLAGLCAAWLALTVKHPRLRFALLAAAGACWAMSAGSRISLPPAVAAMTLLTLGHLWRGRIFDSRGKTFLASACLIVPLAAGAAALAWYNDARFGSMLESGESYQLSAEGQANLIGSGFLSARHVVPNTLVYLLTPPGLSGDFPYLLVVDARPWLSKLFSLSTRYFCDPLAGLLWTQPFLILALAPLLRKRREESLHNTDQSPRTWLLLCLTIGTILAIAPPLAMDFSSIRYLIDAVPLLTILATAGYWHLLDSLNDRPRAAREIRSAVRAVVALQCVIGVLLAISRSPTMFHRIATWFPIL